MSKQDIRVVFDTETKLRDISLGDDGDLSSVDDFSTSIDLSVLTNERANSSEVPQAIERRGWIGDLTPITEGFRVGSKLWLFEQSRRTQETVNDIRNAVQEGLQWIVDKGQAERIQVDSEMIGTSGVRITVVISVGNNRIKRYFTLWDQTEERFI